jgi:undecaprenyl phosphate-alpha-L-ara4N flippase subunit ArnE
MESKSIKQHKGILFVSLLTVLLSFAQVMLKKGALNLELSLRGIILNPWLIAGVILYGLSVVLLVATLRLGNLSTLYPVLGLGYIWVALLSFFLFREIILPVDIIGIALIVMGVGLLGGTKNE